MHSLTLFVRAGDREPPAGFELLGAPIVGVAGESPTSVRAHLADAGQVIGRVDGAFVDAERRLASFVVRKMEDGALSASRVLVPLTVVRVPAADADGTRTLGVTWTRQQLLAQPEITESSGLPDSPVNSGDSAVLRWVVPVSSRSGINPHHALGSALIWALASAAAISVGLLAVGAPPWAVIWTALFFGAGAGIAGYMNGAARDAVIHAHELPRPVRLPALLLALENALKNLPVDADFLREVAVELRLMRTGRGREAHGSAAVSLRDEPQDARTVGQWHRFDPLGRLFRSDDKLRLFALDLLRIFLGMALVLRGVLFIRNPELIDELLRSHHFVLPALIQHYLVTAHLIGGLMLATGFLTRLAAAIQLPALLGAVFLTSLYGASSRLGHELELSALVFVLLLIFLAVGSGPLSFDARMSRSAAPSRELELHSRNEKKINRETVRRGD